MKIWDDLAAQASALTADKEPTPEVATRARLLARRIRHRMMQGYIVWSEDELTALLEKELTPPPDPTAEPHPFNPTRDPLGSGLCVECGKPELPAHEWPDASGTLTLWEPIETAPKDGRRILMANNDEASQGYWDREVEEEGGQCWRFDGPDMERFEPVPTHWMRLPDPPIASELEKET